MATVKRKVGTANLSLSAAIRELREQLGISQDTFARKLGCSLAAYQRWELGTRVPRPEWLMRMLEFCPDDATRAAFGLKFEISGGRGAGGDGRELTEEQEERLRNYNDAVTGINILYEAAEAGHAGAEEALRDLANRINKRAGDWRRMKYLKK